VARSERYSSNFGPVALGAMLGARRIAMPQTERWKVEVVDAEISEYFGSEASARRRFRELVDSRYDHEIVNLYQIGSNGTEISGGSQRGRRRLTS
jgi:hypothetical protein